MAARGPSPSGGSEASTPASYVYVNGLKMALKQLYLVRRRLDERVDEGPASEHCRPRAVGLDIEGDLSRTGRLSLIQLKADGLPVILFDIIECPEVLTEPSGLRALLQDCTVSKVLHDLRRDSEALQGQFGVRLCNVFDTQLAYARITPGSGRRRLGLNAVLSRSANLSWFNLGCYSSMVCVVTCFCRCSCSVGHNLA